MSVLPQFTASSPPTGALLQVTRYCNLRCAHCSQDAPSLCARADHTELPTAQWLTILRHLKHCGVPRVRFTGGEPFTRRDIETLCREAATLQLQPSFVTNGLAIVPKHISWLREVRPVSIWLSFYGYPATAYDRVVGQVGLFSKAMGTLDALGSACGELGLYISLGEDTADAIGTLLQDVYYRGVRKIKMLQLLPIGRFLDQNDIRPMTPQILSRVLGKVASVIGLYPGMSVKVSMRAGQIDLFMSNGFSVPSDRNCYAGLHHIWTVDADGCAIACCLGLGQGAPPLFNVANLAEVQDWRKWDRATSLSQMQFNEEPPSQCIMLSFQEPTSRREFVCPLTYAEIGG